MATPRFSALFRDLSSALPSRTFAQTTIRNVETFAFSRSLFTPARQSSLLRHSIKWAPARRFTTASSGYSSSIWGKSSLMLAGGLGYLAVKAVSGSERAPLGLSVVECEAAVEVDATQLIGCWYIRIKEDERKGGALTVFF